jgi:hypothetical protein
LSTAFARDAWRELPLTIETKSVDRLARPALAGGVRTTAVVRLSGGGVEGVGEEVTFQADDLLVFSAPEPWRFTGTLGEFCEWLARIELFVRAPRYDAVRRYRSWAFQAAALDLALRQATKSLPDLVGLEPSPVRFVVSPPVGFTRWPATSRLKIDASDLRSGLPVDVIDFKGRGTRALVEAAVGLYPDALLEDPPLVSAEARVSWDTEIVSAADVERLAEPPAAINVKPARLGSLAALFDLYELCRRERIAVYGGGQHELGPGRAQIQELAGLFSPAEPNDVAPAAYNDAEPEDDLPESPLHIAAAVGFGRVGGERAEPDTWR